MLIVLSICTFYFGRDDLKKKKKGMFDLKCIISAAQHDSPQRKAGEGANPDIAKKRGQGIPTSGSAERPHCPSQGTEPSWGSFLNLHPPVLVLGSTAFPVPSSGISGLGLSDPGTRQD